MSAEEQGQVQAAVGRPGQVQAVQEGLESVLTLLESVRVARQVQAVVQHVAEAQEVQDQPNPLPPDQAALAHPGRPLTGRQPRRELQGCPPGPAEGQRC